METVMNDNDSKAFLEEMARLYPKYKDNFGAVSNLIVLLMEELQKERKGRKRGENFEKVWGELKKKNPPVVINFVENYGDVRTTIEQSKMLRDFMMCKLEREYFPKPKAKKED